VSCVDHLATSAVERCWRADTVRVLGENPPCVAFDAESARYRVLAGNYFGDGPEIFDGD